MKQTLLVAIAVVAIVAAGFGGYFLSPTKMVTQTVTETTTLPAVTITQPPQTVTTTVTVTPTPTPTQRELVVLTEGQREGPLLVQRIYPDYVTGLNFIEYPVALPEGMPITLRVGDSASNGCTITLTLVKIQDKTATFLKIVDLERPCPICLSEGTLIDTPDGPVNVEKLRSGMAVWTVDLSGHRQPAVILKTAKKDVVSPHLMVHLVLEDGRELLASPGHPTADGRTLSDLSPGDILDGARIKIAERVLYQGKATFDILPSGGTGYYWANGILIGSTLTETRSHPCTD